MSLGQEGPAGTRPARLIILAMMFLVPLSVLGLFGVGDQRDCALAREALVCSSPGTWVVIAMAHAVVLVGMLAAAVVGSHFRVLRERPPLAWVRGWAIAATVVSLLAWWMATA